MTHITRRDDLSPFRLEKESKPFTIR